MRYCDKDKDATQGYSDVIEPASCGFTGYFANPMPPECEEKNQLLTINGVCSREKIENFLEEGHIRRWTEIVVPEAICIPEVKPDIEQIISISAIIEMISQRVVKTPVKTTEAQVHPPIFNQEGTAITGLNLVTEGIVRQKIVYSAAQTQSVHAIHFDMPFSAFIVLDPQDSPAKRWKVDVCIEDISVMDIAPRRLFMNVILIIKALPLVR